MSVDAIARKLGGKRVFRRELKSEADLIAQVRAGMPAAALDSIIVDFGETAGVIQAVIYDVVGKARTLQRKRQHRAVLSSDESDRLARLARMLVRAEEAIGDKAKAYSWLVKPNRALGGQSPLSLLDNDTGTLSVERVLGRIEHGVYS
jgi:putative toxin-antitoxin system antitoxin component (TIGR02293 family)